MSVAQPGLELLILLLSSPQCSLAEFEVSLAHIASSRTVWAIVRDSVSRNEKKRNKAKFTDLERSAALPLVLIKYPYM